MSVLTFPCYMKAIQWPYYRGPARGGGGVFLFHITVTLAKISLIPESAKYTPNANMADLSVGLGLAARKRG